MCRRVVESLREQTQGITDEGGHIFVSWTTLATVQMWWWSVCNKMQTEVSCNPETIVRWTMWSMTEPEYVCSVSTQFSSNIFNCCNVLVSLAGYHPLKERWQCLLVVHECVDASSSMACREDCKEVDMCSRLVDSLVNANSVQYGYGRPYFHRTDHVDYTEPKWWSVCNQMQEDVPSNPQCISDRQCGAWQDLNACAAVAYNIHVFFFSVGAVCWYS